MGTCEAKKTGPLSGEEDGMDWLLIVLLAWGSDAPPVKFQIPVETEELCIQAAEQIKRDLTILGKIHKRLEIPRQGAATEPPLKPPTEASELAGPRVRKLRPGEIVIGLEPVPARMATTCLKVAN